MLIKPQVIRTLRWLAVLPWIIAAAGTEASPPLSDEDLRQISQFEQSPSLLDVPEFAREDMEPRVREAYSKARALFAGRGPELARHFLTHSGHPPSNSAWFFVLEAVADADTAILLIQALWDPPVVESGPPISAGGKTWMRERDRAEIQSAIASVLVDDAVSAAPSVLEALLEALERMRPARPELGPGDASRVVELMGYLKGGAAASALRHLASDPDPSIRSLALQGLGKVAGDEPQQAAAESSDTLSEALHSETDPRGRIEAAAALANIGSPEAGDTLQRALASEQHPMVVDAIVAALEKLDVRWPEAADCGDIVARSWEPGAARGPFACWREGATDLQLIDAAISSPGLLRVLALRALVAAPPITIDEASRERLLDSVVELLSRPSGAMPGPNAELSTSAVWMLHDVLWELAGQEMRTALRYADEIGTQGMRYTTQGRFGASYALFHKDSEGYMDYRRPRQLGLGVLCVIAFSALMLWRRTRRLGLALTVAALAWILWSLGAEQLRELPPPPLQFLTLSAIGSASAGFTVATFALLERRPWPRSAAAVLVRTGLAALGAGVLAFFLCGYTRWSGVFPIGGEGWELIFDPIGSAVIAIPTAIALSLLDALAASRKWASMSKGN